MINLSNAEVSGAVCYHSNCWTTNNVWTDSLCINAKVHATLQTDSYGQTISAEQACDGSCTHTVSVTEAYRQLFDRDFVGNRVLFDPEIHVVLEESAFLLASEVSVVGRLFKKEFDSDSADRFCAFCTGSRHISITSTVEGDYWQLESKRVHRVSGQPCDGSCKKPVTLRRKLVRKLQRQLRWIERA